MKHKVYYTGNNSLLDILQKSIAFVIGVCFLLGLIPFYFDDIYTSLITLIGIQLIISIIRLRFFNIIFEIILAIFAFLSLIPVVGYVFRFLGFLFALIDLAGFNSGSSFRIVKFGNVDKKVKSVSKEKKKQEFKDAEFREK